MVRMIAVLAVFAVGLGEPGAPPSLSGRVEAADGAPAPGALVTADLPDGRRLTVYAGDDGGFRLPAGAEAAATLRARLPGVGATEVAARDGAVLRLGADSVAPPGAAWLAELPRGEERRRFILDCTGCHVTDAQRIDVADRRRSAGEWRSAIALMTAQYGPGTGFPIISSWVDPESLSSWLADGFADARPETPSLRGPTGTAGRAILTEYPIPEPSDLPHDLMVAADGEVWITGMFTHRMYRLDPASGAFETTPIPVPFANPRALDLDEAGRVWVVLGGPGQVAVHDANAGPSGEWSSHDVGMYAHSIAVGPDGRGWVNGHFTHAPERIAAVDAASGDVEFFQVPPDPTGADGESTIPYGLRVGPDGTVWGTQLRGNRLIRLDPATGDVDQWSLPVSHAGPRRPDVGVDGAIWIPLYSANALARFDPVTEEFRVWDFPVDGALPYVARVDRRRGTVWIGTGHGDVVASFDPDAEAFTLYPLPTRGALIRHLDVDEERGEVWFAYGASPGIPGAVLRLAPGEG